MRILLFATISVVLAGSTACRSSKDYVKEGDRLFASQRYPDAVLIYRKAIQKDPKSVEAYYKLGLAQRAVNNNPAALALFLHAVALNPDFEKVQIELGDLYLGVYLIDPAKNAAIYEKICRIADGLLQKDPASYAGLRLRGYLAISDKKPQEALARFSRANEIRPGQPDIVLGLTQGLLLAGRYDEARKTALNQIEKDKAFGPLYDVLYAYEMSTGHAGAAESILKLKIANNPQKPEFTLQLAQHDWRTGKKNDAFKLLNDLLNSRAPWDSYVRVTDFYSGIRDWDRALATLDLGRESHPEKKLLYLKQRAGVLAVAGRPKEAISILSDVLKDQPSATDAKRERAILLLDSTDKKDRALALQELQALAGADPNDTELLFQLGRAYTLNGIEDQAKQQFESVIKKDTRHLPALLALAELASRSKQFQQSLRYSEWILAINPKASNARLLHATALVGLGRLDQARSEYVSLVREEPQYVEAKLQLALLNVVQRRFSAAEKLFRETYRPGNGDFRALKGLIEVEAAQGRWERAIGVLTAEVHRFPDAIAVRNLLAETAVRANKPELAIQQYEWIRERQGDDVQACTELGQLYERSHDLSRSIAMLQRARELAPNDWKTFARLAAVQQEAGLQPEAKSNYLSALQLGADVPDLFNNLAYLEAEMGDNLDQALLLARRALAKSPTNSRYADTVAFIYLKKKDTASALEVFQALSKKYPQDAIFRYHLALALLKSGNKARGEQELKTAIDEDPSLADSAKKNQHPR